MCPLSVPLALCSTRNLKEYDCTPPSDPPQLHHGALNTPPALHTAEVAFDPGGRVREKSGRAPVSGRWLGG
ncbi:F-box protein [Dissostichus eleginoides]|uniref:F-box protein n=1 Tax=Dissostichus eleginoides TaxID=100907 RepID=A0AAD9C3X1_DISEL|nr:F-box protein [Dissostichus eleginoides]